MSNQISDRPLSNKFNYYDNGEISLRPEAMSKRIQELINLGMSHHCKYKKTTCVVNIYLSACLSLYRNKKKCLFVSRYKITLLCTILLVCSEHDRAHFYP